MSTFPSFHSTPPGGGRRRAGGGRYAAAALVGGVSLSLVLSLPGIATAAPGDLDTSFSGDGKALIDVAAVEYNEDVLVQPDGKIVTLGSGFDFDGPNDFILVRHNSNGTLDTTFGGGDGMVATDFGGSTDDVARALTLASNGKIVAVGNSTVEGGPVQVAVARYNSDGSLDTSFSGDGKLVTGLGGTTNAFANTVIMGTDDRIVVGGVYGGDAMVAAITPAGVPEAGWGDDGSGKTVFAYPGGGSAVNALTPAGGEAYVAAGSSPTGFGLMRFFQEAGGTDTSFGDNGKVATPFGNEIRGVALADGLKIVAGGSSGSGVGSEFAVARYNQDGTLDTTFGGGDGTVTTGFGGNGAAGNDMELQGDQKIVVAGGANGDFAVARYNPDGSLDTTFSGDGRVTTDIETFFDEGLAVDLQPDGKIVVSGSDGDNQAVVRYLVSGTPPPPPSVDLSVTKTGPTTVSLGDQATYTIRVTNNSPTTGATGVSISDTLTGGSGTLLSATPSQGGPCTVNPTTMTCRLNTLAPGGSATVTVVAEPRATGTLTDWVAAAAVEQDPNPANNNANAATTVNNARGCTIVGTSATETLRGTSASDVICALSGNDTVYGNDGSDVVYGGAGNDWVSGGAGNDRLIGQTGGDRLNGDGGNDTLDSRDGIGGNDIADGGSGFDTCTTDTGDYRYSCP
ncbi:calcium-binding protein [Streptomyces sp. NPDC058084]|uniref:calcium-binding protein n=1 Tax=Streptomyces sp. NPDC058084 TaxID=3346333 RepID=UPI0036EDA148